MPGTLHRVAAWTLLVLAILALLTLVATRRVRSPAQPGPTVSRNVTVSVAPRSVTTGTSTLTVSLAEDDAAWNATETWIVRDDLAFVTHAFTELPDASSTFELPYPAGEPGSFRLAAFGNAGDENLIGGAAFRVTGTATDQPPGELSAAREGFSVTQSVIPDPVRAGVPTSLTYAVARGDEAVSLETYRDARGALAAFREGGNVFVLGSPQQVALQPSPSAASFTLGFPEPGRYRLFFEFRTAGRPFVEARWIEVLPGEAETAS